MQRAGGTLNGSTWLERTNYFETVPSNQLALALWLEADRMGALLPAMTQQKLDTQRDVVKNERRWSVDNQPYGTWWETAGARFPATHPFHHSLIGSMEDLRRPASMTSSSSSRRTTRPTTPCSRSRAISTAQTRELVERYFGPIPRGTGKPATAARHATSSRLSGECRRELVPDEVMLPRLFLAFRSPVFG